MGRNRAKNVYKLIKGLAPPSQTPITYEDLLMDGIAARVKGPRKVDRTLPRDQCRMTKKPEDLSQQLSEQRLPLGEVVRNCTRWWFYEAFKEAKAGNRLMQVLVGQMYHCGYGVTKDADKGQAWVNSALKSRSEALRVGNKHPGYDVSDSDSDESTSTRK